MVQAVLWPDWQPGAGPALLGGQMLDRYMAGELNMKQWDSDSRVASVVRALCDMWDGPKELRQRKEETWARLLQSIGAELEP